MKTIKYLFGLLLCACFALTFVSCGDDPVDSDSGNGSGSKDSFVGTWHGWMDNYKKNPEEGHIWKWGEFGCLTVKSDNTAELEWWDGDDFESTATMIYSWKKTADGYLLTYKSVRMTNPNDKEFNDFACDIQITMTNSTTIDLGMWIGDSDEDHEQMTKGKFDLGQYRDLSKKDFYETTWHGTLGGYSCELDLHTFGNLKLYKDDNQYPSYYLYYNYTKEGDVYKFTKDADSDKVSGFDNLEMQYISSSQIKIRQQGSSTWSTFTPGKYTPPTPSTDWAALLKGTTWEMKEDGELLSITFDSNGKKGVFIYAEGDEDDEAWDPDWNCGNFTYTVSGNNIIITFNDYDNTVVIKSGDSNQLVLSSSTNFWGDVTVKKVTNTLTSSNVVGTWKYTDEDGDNWVINLASTGKGYLKYEDDKETIYWALSGKYILIMDDEYEPEYVLTVFDHGSKYLTIYFDELDDVVTFKK